MIGLRFLHLVFVVFNIFICDCADKKRNAKQQIVDYSKQSGKQTSQQTGQNVDISETQLPTEYISDALSTETINIDIKPGKEEKTVIDALTSLTSRKCTVATDQVKYATQAYWRHDYVNAYICARDIANVKSIKVNGVIQSILYNIYQIGSLNSLSFNDIATLTKVDLQSQYSLSKLDANPKLSQWEVLGPIPVSKLEIDADPTFNQYYSSKYKDIIEYLLAMSSDTNIYSEHVENGFIRWKIFTMNMRSGQIEINFPDINWNSLYQGIGSAAAIEMQGWIRTTTYVTKTSVYKIHCLGVHTFYIRNDNTTRLLIGDIYQNPDHPITASVELKAGIVGLVAPIRGIAQATFSCALKNMHIESPTAGQLTNNNNGNDNSKTNSNAASITSNKQTLHVASVYNVPNLILCDDQTIDTYISLYKKYTQTSNNNNEIEIKKKLKSSGMLLSSVFAVNLQNLDSKSLSVEIQLESTQYSIVNLFDNNNNNNIRFSIRQARSMNHHNNNDCNNINTHSNSDNNQDSPQQGIGTSNGKSRAKERQNNNIKSLGNEIIIIPPGQTRAISLEMYSNSHSHLSSSAEEEASLLKSIFLPCQRNANTHSNTNTNQDLTLVFSPSRGMKVRTKLEFKCRQMSESFLLSYVDHDDSISQTGVVFPLPLSNFPTQSASRKKSRNISVQDKLNNNKNNNCKNDNSNSQTCSNNNSNNNNNNHDSNNDSDVIMSRFPYILTLHGTGLTATNQADAYKEMKRGSTEYTFGVEGFFIIAPSRHGAHNWESVGDLSARSAVTSLKYLLSYFRFLLPQVSSEPGIIAGHSMGGHGAWILAVNSPDLGICLSPSASWIRKEEYAKANAFFELDIQNSYIPTRLKNILEMSMSEFHIDRLAVYNLLTYDIHMRVGSSDMTTHPWFTRRMFRLLISAGVNATIEEVGGKEHWWWDTLSANDGGALNDKKVSYIICYM